MKPIQHFRHCPACGGTNLEPQEEQRCVHCTSCGFHLHFNPAIGVGVILCGDDGRVLLLRRSREPGRGLLGLPGGFADVGETAEEVLQREVREETGGEIPASAFTYLCSRANSYPYKGVTYAVLDLFFTGRWPADAIMQLSDEADGHVWLAPQEIDLDTIAFSSIRYAVALYRERVGV